MENLPTLEVPTITETVETAAPLPPVESSGGFPWCGAGIVVGVVALAAVCAKLYKCTAKK